MENKDYSYIDANFASVKERLERAALSAGRKAEDIAFLAAIKSADIGEINHLHRELCIDRFGENRVQQLMSRYDDIDKRGIRLDFIGKLQRNKVKYIIDKVDMIHSVDSKSLADEISSRAVKACKCMDVLMEINIGEEPDKSGVMPDLAAETAMYIDKLDGIRLCGFMTMAPICSTEKQYRTYFSKMRELSFEIWSRELEKEGHPELSMGMSGSFEAAVAEGATVVRIGRCLFQKDKM